MRGDSSGVGVSAALFSSVCPSVRSRARSACTSVITAPYFLRARGFFVPHSFDREWNAPHVLCVGKDVARVFLFAAIIDLSLPIAAESGVCVYRCLRLTVVGSRVRARDQLVVARFSLRIECAIVGIIIVVARAPPGTPPPHVPPPRAFPYCFPKGSTRLTRRGRIIRSNAMRPAAGGDEWRRPLHEKLRRLASPIESRSSV